MKYQVLPDLTPIEYEALKADIAQHGVLVPVEMDENGELLDGHHRKRAWMELRAAGVDLPDYPRLIRTGMTEEEKRDHALRLNINRRQLSKEQRDALIVKLRQEGKTLKAIADVVGVSVGTVHGAVSGDNHLFKTEKVTGADGKQYPTTYARKPEPDRVLLIEEDEDDNYLPTPEEQAKAWGGYPEDYEDEQLESEPVPRPHVSHNSGNNEWYTPAEYIQAAIAVMGGIDLDPASSVEANAVVQADTIFTIEDNGLIQSWYGRVFLNPPYAQPLIGQFCDKLGEEWDNGLFSEGIVLVNNATETAWFRTLISRASAVVFPQSRIKFWQPSGIVGAPLQGQAFIYFGDFPTVFLSQFSRFGWGAHCGVL